MFAGKMLVILYAPISAEGARSTVQNALLTAARPENLHFALPSYAREDLEAEMNEKQIPCLFFDYREGLPAAAELITNETHFLLLMGDACFSSGWDNELFSSLRRSDTLLTGSVWYQEDTGDAEVCFPALREPFEEHGITIGRGLPLVCAQGKVSTLLIDPALLFGETLFMTRVKPEITGISYSAFLAGYAVYLLESPCVRPVGRLPQRRLCRITPSVTPGTAASRFEQLCGIRAEKHYLTPKARLGLLENRSDYPQTLPAKLSARQKIRDLLPLPRKDDFPVLVTAFTDQPDARQEAAAYLLHFDFLRKLDRLPLVVFTGGSQERAIRSVHLNTLSFPERALSRPEGMKVSQHARRLKAEMLLRVAQRHPELATVAWVDFDILPHPLPEGAVPDFRPLYDGKIHLAMVDGEPDLSFVLVPTSKCRVLAREVSLITSLDAQLGRDFSEEALWKELYEKKPGDFVIHRLPRRQLLFLSLFDPAVLSRQITVHLKKEAIPENGKKEPTDE